MPCYSSVPSQRAPVPADTSPGFPGFPVGLNSMATSRMGSSLLGAQAVLPHCRRLNLRAHPGSMGRPRLDIRLAGSPGFGWWL